MSPCFYRLHCWDSATFSCRPTQPLKNLLIRQPAWPCLREFGPVSKQCLAAQCKDAQSRVGVFVQTNKAGLVWLGLLCLSDDESPQVLTLACRHHQWLVAPVGVSLQLVVCSDGTAMDVAFRLAQGLQFGYA